MISYCPFLFPLSAGEALLCGQKCPKTHRRDVRSATRNRQFLKIVAVVIRKLIALTPKITHQQPTAGYFFQKKYPVGDIIIILLNIQKASNPKENSMFSLGFYNLILRTAEDICPYNVKLITCGRTTFSTVCYLQFVQVEKYLNYYASLLSYSAIYGRFL